MKSLVFSLKTMTYADFVRMTLPEIDAAFRLAAEWSREEAKRIRKARTSR